MTNPDVGGCGEFLKTIYRAYAVFSGEKTWEIFVRWTYENTEAELSKKGNWSDWSCLGYFNLMKKL